VLDDWQNLSFQHRTVQLERAGIPACEHKWRRSLLCFNDKPCTLAVAQEIIEASLSACLRLPPTEFRFDTPSWPAQYFNKNGVDQPESRTRLVDREHIFGRYLGTDCSQPRVRLVETHSGLGVPQPRQCATCWLRLRPVERVAQWAALIEAPKR